MKDAFSVLNESLAPALVALNEQGQRVYNRAVVDNTRAYQEGQTERTRQFQKELIDDARLYQERRDAQREKDKDADELQRLRNTLAALLPPGESVPPDLNQEQLSQQIAIKMREVRLRQDNDDRKRILDWELKAAESKTEAAIRAEAKLYGIPEGGDLATLRKAVAEAKTNEVVDLRVRQQNEAISRARQTPEYQNLRKRLAGLMTERQKILGQVTLPEPVFNPGMTEVESLAIYNEIASMPDFAGLFSDDAKGKALEKAFRSGDYQTALAGMSSAKREELGMKLAESRETLAQRLQQLKGFQYSEAMRAYVRRMSGLPQLLKENEDERKRLYSLGREGGVNYGLALELEDPDAMIQEEMTPPGQMPGTRPVTSVDKTPLSEMNDGLPTDGEVAVDLLAGGLPEPGQFAQESAPQPTRDFEGILPMAGKGFSAFTESPLAIEGATQTAAGVRGVAEGVSGVLDAVGKAGRYARTAVLGGNWPQQTPVRPSTSSAMDLLVGPAKLALSPIQTVGNAVNTLVTPAPGPEALPLPLGPGRPSPSDQELAQAIDILRAAGIIVR